MVSAEVSRLSKDGGPGRQCCQQVSEISQQGDLEHGVKPHVMISPRIVCEGAELAEHPTESETTHTRCR